MSQSSKEEASIVMDRFTRELHECIKTIQERLIHESYTPDIIASCTMRVINNLHKIYFPK